MRRGGAEPRFMAPKQDQVLTSKARRHTMQARFIPR